MDWKWLRRFKKADARGTPAGEVMLECLRRDVQLVLNDEGAIEMHGGNADVKVLSPFVEQHKDGIFRALVAFKFAMPPPTLRELN